MGCKNTKLHWTDEHVPISTQFDDPYFSLKNGVAESQFVFLRGNNLPQRLKKGFSVAELGFGTGLNLVVLLDAWRAQKKIGQISFTSFEAFPITRAEAERAFAQFEGMLEAKEIVLSGFCDDGFSLDHPVIKAKVILGDARNCVAKWDGFADAWFLDGFSPAKNPELWERNLMKDVFSHTNKEGSFATYTAAGFVRDTLSQVGFSVERVKGFAHKRHMTRGIKHG